jgi:hypothetical protein
MDMLKRSLVALALVIGMDLAVPAETVLQTDRSGAVWAVPAASGTVLPALVAKQHTGRSTAAFRAKAAALLSPAELRFDLALRHEGR